MKVIELLGNTCMEGHPMRHPFVRHLVIRWRTYSVKLTLDVRLDQRWWVCGKCIGVS